MHSYQMIKYGISESIIKYSISESMIQASTVLRHSWQQSHNKGLYCGFRAAILSHFVTAPSAWCIMRYTAYPGLVSYSAIPIYPF